MNAAVELIEVESPSVSAMDRLSFTLFVAIALHAFLLLGLTFNLPKATQGSQTMEITLATHKAAKAPTDADFFAAPLAPIVRALERAVVGATMPADAILNTKKGECHEKVPTSKTITPHSKGTGAF